MRDSEAVFGAQATAAYEAANPNGTKWTSLPPGEWGRWNAVVNAVLAIPSNQKDRLQELEQQVAQLTSERDEWAAKWMAERRKYAALRWPGLTATVKPNGPAGVATAAEGAGLVDKSGSAHG